ARHVRAVQDLVDLRFHRGAPRVARRRATARARSDDLVREKAIVFMDGRGNQTLVGGEMESEVWRESVLDGELAHQDPARATPDNIRARAAISRARWRFLAEASRALDRSLDYKETLANVVHLVVPSMADYAGI